MRRYPTWEAIGIKKDRYLELLHFARQYPEWRTEAASLIGTHGVKLDGMPHGSGVGDPVASVAERRAGLLEKIAIIERCARAAQNGTWYAALIQNVCMGRPFSTLDQTIIPANRTAFFKARKEFFLKLHLEKDKQETF